MKEKIINEDYKKYYEIDKILGQGSFGTVYKAKKKNTDEFFAIKVINMDKDTYFDNIDEEDLKQSLINELNIMTICSNENKNNYSTKIFKYFDNSNEFAIIMELCDDNLSKVLRRRGKGFEPEEIKKIMNQLNETFKIMTREKIVHRDIKLENILVKYENDNKEDFIVKLTDYGISKQVSLKTTIQTFTGTRYTMAPEIMEGLKYNNKCDLWSIGIIMYQLVFNELPYSGQTEVVLLKNIKAFKHKKIRKSGDNNLDDLIRKLLEYNVNKRIDWEHYFNHPFFSFEQKKAEKIEVNDVNEYKKNKVNKVSAREDIEGALVCRVALVGESGTNKTAIITRFIVNTFNSDLGATPGSNFITKTKYFKEENKYIKFELWDTPVGEKYRSLVRVFYKKKEVIILVYDITRRRSFEELKNYWINDITVNASPNVSKMISFLNIIYN